MLGRAVLLGVLVQLASIPCATHTHAPAPALGLGGGGARDGEGRLGALLRLRGGMGKLTEAQKQELAEKRVREIAKERKKRNLPNDWVLVPDEVRRIHDVVAKVCGEYRRMCDYPEPSPSGFVEPFIDEFNVATMVEWGQWVPGTGQPVFVRWGEYKWGVWSERRDTFKHPQVIPVNGRLEMYGEDGTVLVGPWVFMENSSGIVKEMLLYSEQICMGRGGSLTLQFCGGNWTIQNCMLQVIPGPMCTVIGMAGKTNLTLDWCHVSKTRNIDFRTWGYGILAWHRATLRADNVTFWSMKTCVDAGQNTRMRFDDCEFINNRYGVYVHDDAKVWMSRSNFTETHRACFVSGRRSKRQGKEVHLDHMYFKGNGQFWQDNDRPDNYTMHSSFTDETWPKPTHYWCTEAFIPGLPGGQECPDADGRAAIEYRRAVVHNFTMLHPTMNFSEIDWSHFDVYNGTNYDVPV